MLPVLGVACKLSANENQAQDLTLEESRLGVRLKSAKADVKTASAKAKRSAHRLDELTAKEDKARRTSIQPVCRRYDADATGDCALYPLNYHPLQWDVRIERHTSAPMPKNKACYF